MSVRTHSTVREGLLVGLAGAAAAALWYFVTDLAAGAPLRTPSTLGQVLVHADSTPSPNHIIPTAVVGYTALHVVTFAVIGVVLTWLVHLVIERRSLRMGLWLAVVLAFTWLVMHTYLLTPATGYRIPWWSPVGGAVIGSLGVASLLWRRHPELRRALDDVPLGDEVESPPAAPGGLQDGPRHH
jgi:hypothetical protein